MGMAGVRVIDKGPQRLPPALQVGEIVRLASGFLYTVVRTTPGAATVQRVGWRGEQDEERPAGLSCQMKPRGRFEISLHSFVERVTKEEFDKLTQEKETNGWVIELDDSQ